MYSVHTLLISTNLVFEWTDPQSEFKLLLSLTLRWSNLIGWNFWFFFSINQWDCFTQKLNSKGVLLHFADPVITWSFDRSFCVHAIFAQTLLVKELKFAQISRTHWTIWPNTKFEDFHKTGVDDQVGNRTEYRYLVYPVRMELKSPFTAAV
jgi:hypothetical protein